MVIHSTTGASTATVAVTYRLVVVAATAVSVSFNNIHEAHWEGLFES